MTSRPGEHPLDLSPVLLVLVVHVHREPGRERRLGGSRFPHTPFGPAPIHHAAVAERLICQDLGIYRAEGGTGLQFERRHFQSLSRSGIN